MNNPFSDWMVQYFEESEDMIIFVDDNNNIIKMNKAAEEILSTEENLEQISRSLCSYCQGFTSDKEMMTCINCFMQNNGGKQSSFQVFMKDKKGQTNAYSASFLHLSGRNLKVLTLQNVSPQIKTQETLHQKNIMQRIINAQENERKRISRELHDSVVQELLNVMVDFRLLKYKSDDEMTKHMQLMEGNMSRLMDDIRTLSVELRPSSLDDLGLEAALRTHFKQLDQHHGMIVNFHSNLNAARFDNEIETAAYRIIQEALFNAVKYADVEEVDVTLNFNGTLLSCRIVDEGVGFDDAHAPQGTGLGLYGMKERAEIVGGYVDIKSEKGQGTAVTLEVPVGGQL